MSESRSWKHRALMAELTLAETRLIEAAQELCRAYKRDGLAKDERDALFNAVEEYVWADQAKEGEGE